MTKTYVPKKTSLAPVKISTNKLWRVSVNCKFPTVSTVYNLYKPYNRTIPGDKFYFQVPQRLEGIPSEVAHYFQRVIPSAYGPCTCPLLPGPPEVGGLYLQPPGRVPVHYFQVPQRLEGYTFSLRAVYLSTTSRSPRGWRAIPSAYGPCTCPLLPGPPEVGGHTFSLRAVYLSTTSRSPRGWRAIPSAYGPCTCPLLPGPPEVGGLYLQPTGRVPVHYFQVPQRLEGYTFSLRAVYLSTTSRSPRGWRVIPSAYGPCTCPLLPGPPEVGGHTFSLRAVYLPTTSRSPRGWRVIPSAYGPCTCPLLPGPPEVGGLYLQPTGRVPVHYFQVPQRLEGYTFSLRAVYLYLPGPPEVGGLYLQPTGRVPAHYFQVPQRLEGYTFSLRAVYLPTTSRSPRGWRVIPSAYGPCTCPLLPGPPEVGGLYLQPTGRVPVHYFQVPQRLEGYTFSLRAVYLSTASRSPRGWRAIPSAYGPCTCPLLPGPPEVGGLYLQPTGRVPVHYFQVPQRLEGYTFSLRAVYLSTTSRSPRGWRAIPSAYGPCTCPLLPGPPEVGGLYLQPTGRVPVHYFQVPQRLEGYTFSLRAVYLSTTSRSPRGWRALQPTGRVPAHYFQVPQRLEGYTFSLRAVYLPTTSRSPRGWRAIPSAYGPCTCPLGPPEVGGPFSLRAVYLPTTSRSPRGWRAIPSAYGPCTCPLLPGPPEVGGLYLQPTGRVPAHYFQVPQRLEGYTFSLRAVYLSTTSRSPRGWRAYTFSLRAVYLPTTSRSPRGWRAIPSAYGPCTCPLLPGPPEVGGLYLQPTGRVPAHYFQVPQRLEGYTFSLRAVYLSTTSRSPRGWRAIPSAYGPCTCPLLPGPPEVGGLYLQPTGRVPVHCFQVPQRLEGYLQPTGRVPAHYFQVPQRLEGYTFSLRAVYLYFQVPQRLEGYTFSLRAVYLPTASRSPRGWRAIPSAYGPCTCPLLPGLPGPPRGWRAIPSAYGPCTCPLLPGPPEVGGLYLQPTGRVPVHYFQVPQRLEGYTFSLRAVYLSTTSRSPRGWRAIPSAYGPCTCPLLPGPPEVGGLYLQPTGRVPAHYFQVPQRLEGYTFSLRAVYLPTTSRSPRGWRVIPSAYGPCTCPLLPGPPEVGGHTFSLRAVYLPTTSRSPRGWRVIPSAYGPCTCPLLPGPPEVGGLYLQPTGRVPAHYFQVPQRLEGYTFSLRAVYLSTTSRSPRGWRAIPSAYGPCTCPLLPGPPEVGGLYLQPTGRVPVHYFQVPQRLEGYTFSLRAVYLSTTSRSPRGWRVIPSAYGPCTCPLLPGPPEVGGHTFSLRAVYLPTTSRSPRGWRVIPSAYGPCTCPLLPGPPEVGGLYLQPTGRVPVHYFQVPQRLEGYTFSLRAVYLPTTSRSPRGWRAYTFSLRAVYLSTASRSPRGWRAIYLQPTGRVPAHYFQVPQRLEGYTFSLRAVYLPTTSRSPRGWRVIPSAYGPCTCPLLPGPPEVGGLYLQPTGRVPVHYFQVPQRLEGYTFSLRAVYLPTTSRSPRGWRAIPSAYGPCTCPLLPGPPEVGGLYLQPTGRVPVHYFQVPQRLEGYTFSLRAVYLSTTSRSPRGWRVIPSAYGPCTCPLLPGPPEVGGLYLQPTGRVPVHYFQVPQRLEGIPSAYGPCTCTSRSPRGWRAIPSAYGRVPVH